MFRLFKKDPAKKLREQYARLLEEARDLQRMGNIKGFALKTAEAEEVAKQLEALSDKPTTS
ncbi:MAG: Lacal_2735 family protein [Saprospirales bacterium]|nr:Lacal_2735 family protein [Saprospirales bacterium]